MQQRLQEILAYIEKRHVNIVQLGLARIKAVAKELCLLQTKVPIITVAGTNGKGSTVAALEAMYVAGGYTVGAYTSPHLILCNERIRVNQKAITDKDFVLALEVILQAKKAEELTFFEVITLAALWHFASLPLQLIILEVGLGGRLDATNIMDSELAIITTVDLDHQAYLGNSKEEIGAEKAGIIRKKKPVIYADDTPPVSIVQKVQQEGGDFFRKGVEYQVTFDEDSLHVCYQEHSFAIRKTALHPHSLAAAIMASICLQNMLPLRTESIGAFLENLRLLGRMQSFTVQGKTVLVDVAHNPQAVEYLSHLLQKKYQGRLHLVFAALKDKDVATMIALMDPMAHTWYPCKLQDARALSEEDTERLFLPYAKCPYSPFLTPEIAVEKALQEAHAEDCILVFGSFVTVGAVVSYLQNRYLKGTI